MKKLTLFLSLAVVLSFAVVAKAQAPLSYRVDTINDLIGITLYGSDAKAIAYVGGGTARNDGLGGLFFYDGTSSQTTNTYAVYKPTSVTTGRWFKLPTSVVNQETDVTVATEATYAWKLLDGNAANAFSIGLTSANVYMQTWGSRPLYINSSLGGNNTIINATGGNVGIGTDAPTAYTGTTTLAINNAVWGGRLDLMFAGVVKSSLSLNTSLNTILESAQSTTHGYDLQLTSGQAAAGTDLDGGDVIVSGGASTGTGASAIYLQTATPGATGTGSNAATTKVAITGAGNVGIGTDTPVSLTEIRGGLTTAGSILTLGTKEPSVVVSDVLGRVDFYAPLDAAGTDANLVAGSIVAQAEGTFSATSNATSLLFQTGSSEVATTKLTISSAGAATFTGTVAIGSGTPIAKVLSATDTLDFGNTATLTSTDLTITVTGAAVGDSVAIGLPAAPDANGCFTGWVSAANTVTVRFNNYSAGSIDPASATYRATVTQF
jgi:hypothetical protein